MSSLDLCSLLGAAHRTARGLGPLVDAEECVASGVLRGIPAFRKSVDALITSTAHLGLAAANLRRYLDIIVELCHLLFDPLPTRPPDPTPIDDDMTPAQQEIKEHLTCCSALRPKLQSTTCGDGSNPDLFIMELKPTLMCARVSLPSLPFPLALPWKPSLNRLSQCRTAKYCSACGLEFLLTRQRALITVSSFDRPSTGRLGDPQARVSRSHVVG